jgi:hypothetical protein
METFEVHAHLWVQDDMWLCGIIDPDQTTKIAPDTYGYSALSSLEPNMLIHCYWIPELPDDDTRDYVRDLIVDQALAFYRARHDRR